MRKQTAAIYARTDSDDPYMLHAQVNELSRFVNAHPDFIGWDVTLYQDHHANNGKQPQLETLLEAIRLGKVQCVIVKNLSRIARDSMALMYYMEHFFFAHHARLISLTEQFDTTDPTTRSLLDHVSRTLSGEKNTNGSGMP